MSKQLKLSIKKTIEYWLIKADRNKTGRTTIQRVNIQALKEAINNYMAYHGSDEC